MSLEPTTFETIVPSRYVTFTFPNTLPHPFPPTLHTPLIRIAVLDSPTTATATAKIAAMLVPPKRESDWTFSTEPGHFQLLLSFPSLSRLILIANHNPNCPRPTSYERPSSPFDPHPSIIEENLMPLLLALTPKSAFEHGFPEVPFLSYEDEVMRSLVIETCVGPSVGEMLIENVELKLPDDDREFRRRLRFKRMPNLIQSQVRIYPNNSSGLGEELDSVDCRLDNTALVQPYLSPMVAGLSVINSYLDGRIRGGFRPKALSLGVGGGALISFLSAELGFAVLGVEEDEVVLSVARKFFGLRDSELVHLCVGDGIELIQKLAFGVKDQNGCNNENGHCLEIADDKYDVVMVDLDSSDAKVGSCAPPVDFVRKPVFLAAREVICEQGVLVINVIPPSKSFYETLVAEFQGVFKELYEIGVGNEENFVLVASASEIQTATGDQDNYFLQKLKMSIQESYIDSIRKISTVDGS